MPIIGGLASAASGPGKKHWLWMEKLLKKGWLEFVCMAVLGLKPWFHRLQAYWDTFIVTRAQRNIIYELAGRPFYKVLEEELK